MWITRDSLGELALYAEKPHKTEYKNGLVLFGLSLQECETKILQKNIYGWRETGNDASCQVVYLNPDLFPEVTCRNSPVEIKLEINNE